MSEADKAFDTILVDSRIAHGELARRRPAPLFMPETSDAHLAFREMLYRKFRLQPHPLVMSEQYAIPAATLWTGARTWVNRFRAAGLTPGNRVVLAVPRTPSQIMVTIAAWWEGLTLCPVVPSLAGQPDALLETFDASLVVAEADGAHVARPDPAGGAGDQSEAIARPAGALTDDIALIMTTSGSSGSPKHVALSFANVHHHLRSHTEALGITTEDRVYSMLPWNHAFGMLVDLWPAMLSGAMIVVDPLDGRSSEATLAAIHEHDITCISMVPIQTSQIAAIPGGIETLASLDGGVVGGAPLSLRLAEILSGTKLRPGYGQTEASPGITLGRPGVFFEGALGTPLGCETRIVDNELHVRGANVCAGFWRDGSLDRLAPDRWLATGDLVEAGEEGLRFVGRLDHCFKLDNGRMIDTPHLERAARDALGAEAVVLYPDNGIGLHAVVVCCSPAMRLDSEYRASIAAAIGKEGKLLTSVSVVEHSARLRTRKGEIDRARLLESVTGTFGGSETVISVAA